MAYYEPQRIEDARASIEELVGPLAWFEEPCPGSVSDEEQAFNPILDGSLDVAKLPNEDMNVSSNGIGEADGASDPPLNVLARIDQAVPQHDPLEENFPVLNTERICNCCSDPHAPFGAS